MIERDRWQWFFEWAGVVSGTASVIAIYFAKRALNDSADTARHLETTARAVSLGLQRVELEQAASVLDAEGFLHDLNRQLDRDRAERVQRLLRAAGPNGPPDAA